MVNLLLGNDQIIKIHEENIEKLNNSEFFEGNGPSIKQAEQSAAELFLKNLNL